jgi:hypothetical protein
MTKLSERLVIGSGMIALVVLAIMAYEGDLFGGATELIQETIYMLAPFVAVLAGVSAVLRIGTRGRLGRSLINITVGLLLWLIGEVIWVVFEYGLGIDPFPSLADFFYLVAYIPLFIGIYLQVQGEAVKAWRNRLLVLALLSASLVAIVSYAGIYLAYDPTATMLENSIAMAYGLDDLVLVLVGLFVYALSVEYRGGRLAVAGWFFLLGLVAILAADILFAIFVDPYEAGELAYIRIDLLWILGYLAIGYSLYYRGEIASRVHKKLLKKQGQSDRV